MRSGRSYRHLVSHTSWAFSFLNFWKKFSGWDTKLQITNYICACRGKKLPWHSNTVLCAHIIRVLRLLKLHSSSSNTVPRRHLKWRALLLKVQKTGSTSQCSTNSQLGAWSDHRWAGPVSVLAGVHIPSRRPELLTFTLHTVRYGSELRIETSGDVNTLK